VLNYHRDYKHERHTPEDSGMIVSCFLPRPFADSPDTSTAAADPVKNQTVTMYSYYNHSV